MAVQERATGIALPEATTRAAEACPRCHAAIALGASGGEASCPACGLAFRNFDGIISCAAAQRVNDWQAFFESRAAAPDRDTSGANDYRSPLQQRYIAEAFRRAC